jgi:hypothetical protein
LDSVHAPNAAVGKIRRIHRIFIVSIVDASPPYRLQRQIGIRVGDGRVVVLN